MRASFFNKFDNIDDPSFQAVTVQFTGPLILHADPNEPLHIATKRYVDNRLGSGLNANTITSGIIPGARLPIYTGDVTNSLGSTVFTLSNTGVSAGNYTKVTVDAKGRITAGSQLTEADIPDLSWTKIVSGKPTTLVGYGINDAVRSTGDSLVGTLTVTGNPSNPLHAVTKQYVDNRALGLNGNERTGTIIRRTSPVAPSGYLRCNGSSLNKANYPALYAVVGDRFGNTTQLGNGRPWVSQYLINTLQNSTLGSWLNTASLPIAVANARVVVTKNTVFLLGGILNDNENAALTSIYSAPINEDGTLGVWTVIEPLPRQLQQFAVIVIRNKLYVIGGSNGTTNATMSTTIYQTTITTEGTLSNWITYPISLPKPLHQVAAFVTNNRLYLLGGNNTAEGSQKTVYTCLIDEEGNLDTFTSDADLPIAVANSQVVVIKNFVYLIGGQTTANTATADIFRAAIDEDGVLGNWSLYGSFPVAVTFHQLVSTTNYLYVIGGHNGSTYYNTVYSSAIQEDGSLGTWTLNNTLPNTLAGHQTLVTATGLYLLGGKSDNTTYSSAVLSTPFTGGMNDYSNYYDNTVIPVEDSNMFRLPNYTKHENSAAYYFIKYN